MAEPAEKPRFRELTLEECTALLQRNRVGRVAFERGNRIDIVPVHYVLAQGVICGRTSRGTRLERATGNFYGSWPVAFEVDEVDSLFSWRSVVVHGNLHAASRDDAEWQRSPAEWEDTLRSFQTLVPEAFTDDDPTAFRDVLMRIDIGELSGREAVPGDPGPQARNPAGRRGDG